ncbi:haloacid dehalogenase [Paraoerskovia sediminicola]|uniref:Haloacid dehalogenase n=1 Tax=Paraoerskovia sediminicola TaxID=1138587 RepID=A0ABN6XG99_9CELL|nr:HAD-IIA family hydrolase [Paraoerskovia sediminicola]BDZ43780.1 haloacid dehalogenase [Paraoerskovia sediminicola]
MSLVDLDGVAYKGHEPVDHAASSLAAAREAGMRLVFVTNNASREPEQVAAQLTDLDIPTEPGDVMTAAQAAAALLATRLAPGATVLVIGGAGLRTAVRAQGFEIVGSADDRPDAVVQGFSPELGWSDLAEAAYAVQGGAWHVASNRDMSLPQARGMAPGNGTLVAAVVSATGVEPESAGKPEPTMYRLACERAGVEEALVIGDRLDTDLAGARAGGYPGLHVLTGVSSARDAILAEPGLRPHFVGKDLRALNEPHPEPEPAGDGWWRCRDGAARVVDGRLELAATSGAAPAGGGSSTREATIDTVRAACGAAWSAVDDGVELDESSVPEIVVTD